MAADPPTAHFLSPCTPLSSPSPPTSNATARRVRRSPPQGIVGCFPWQAAVFFTLWLQLQGFASSTASAITATFGAGVAMVGRGAALLVPAAASLWTAVALGLPWSSMNAHTWVCS
jgi:hypothetical protein